MLFMKQIKKFTSVTKIIITSQLIEAPITEIIIITKY